MPRVPERTVERLERRVLMAFAPVGPEFRVNSYTTSDQFLPAIAMDADGDFVVGWESYGQDGSASGIYVQRFSASGAAQGSELPVNALTQGYQQRPDLAMHADGGFVVVFDGPASSPGGAAHVNARRYDAAGFPLDIEVPVTTTGLSQTSPSVAMDADGDYVITWHSFEQDGSGLGVYARRFDRFGLPVGDEFRVNTFTTGNQVSPEVAVAPGGDFVIVWASKAQDDGFAYGVYAQRYDAAGAAQGPEVRVNEYTTGAQWLPSVAMDDDGDFIIAWQSEGQDGSSGGVYARQFGSDGSTAGSEFPVNTFTTQSQGDPHVAVGPEDEFVITWQNQIANVGIFARQFSESGEPLGNEFRVNSITTGNPAGPSIALDDAGHAAVVWSRTGDGSQHGVYAQRFTNPLPPPGVTASEFAFETAPHRLNFTFTQNVGPSLSASDMELRNLTTSQTISPADLTVAFDPATKTAIFAYTGGGGVLPDGNYRATLLASQIRNSTGTPMAADYVLLFHVLAADATRDARVNLDDFNVLAANFGQSSRTFSQGDFNYDGTVNLADFNLLASRFGAVIAPASASSGPRVSRDRRDPLDDLLG